MDHFNQGMPPRRNRVVTAGPEAGVRFACLLFSVGSVSSVRRVLHLVPCHTRLDKCQVDLRVVVVDVAHCSAVPGLVVRDDSNHFTRD